MNPSILDAVRDTPPLLGLFVVSLPDCQRFYAWHRESTGWSLDEVCGYFGELIRANRAGLRALSSGSEGVQITIESQGSLVILRDLSSAFALGCVFDRAAPLGLVRVHMTRLVERVSEALPKGPPVERTRGEKIVEHLLRHAPDPHVILPRTSLRSGIELGRLRAPSTLADADVDALERVACHLLGLAAPGAPGASMPWTR